MNIVMNNKLTSKVSGKFKKISSTMVIKIVK